MLTVVQTSFPDYALSRFHGKLPAMIVSANFDRIRERVLDLGFVGNEVEQVTRVVDSGYEQRLCNSRDIYSATTLSRHHVYATGAPARRRCFVGGLAR